MLMVLLLLYVSCEEDRCEAMKVLDGYEWRGKSLTVKVSFS